MSDDQWRWADPGGQQRKVRLDELRAALASGHIAANAPVWRPGWTAWKPAHEVPELSSASLGGANGVVLNIPPPPLEMVAVQQEYEASASALMPAPAASDAAVEEPPPPPAYVPIPAKAPAPPASGSAPVLAPSLPTAIGLPPPPDVLAIANARSGAPPPMPPRPRDRESIEEISASMLIDAESESMSNVAISSAGAGLAPPTTPVVNDTSAAVAEEGVAGVPGRIDLGALLTDFAELREGRLPKNKLAFAAIGGVGLTLAILFVAGIASLFGGSSPSGAEVPTSASVVAKSAPPPSAEAAAEVPAPAAAAQREEPSVAQPEEPSAAPAPDDCTASGDGERIAPRAVVASGVEAVALGGAFALGFATGPRDAVAVSLDPSSLARKSLVRVRPTGGDARRVTPVLLGTKLAALPDVDRKGDPLSTRRLARTSSLVDVGYADGAIAWAPRGQNAYRKLFSLDGDAPVEALRAVPLAEGKGIGVTFRRDGAIFVGVAKGEGALEADGDLSRLAGLGEGPGTLGSPSIASSGDRVLVAWADRADTESDWGVHLAIRSAGSTSAPSSFAVPAGGLGGQAMSPNVAALGDGRFLLAWTEGPISNHQVRAVTLAADGSPSGAPITISAPDLNAGQPAAAVGPDGRGVVAFLAAKGKALEVHARPIRCPAR